MSKLTSFNEKALVFAKTPGLWFVLFLGFCSGLPLMLVFSSIKIWLRKENIDLSTIGMISWVSIPYSFNFLWAFILDRYYFKPLGRRKTWILFSQLGLLLSIGSLGFLTPSAHLMAIVIAGICISFFSATQDLAIDAYRREILPDELLGFGSSLGVYGYRLGMLIASGFALWTVDPKTLGLSFNQMFLGLGALVIVLFILTTLIPEPKSEIKENHSNFLELFWNPLKDFFMREQSLLILLFIFFYKLGDSMAGSMLTTYYVDMGFDNKTIAEITKGIGFISTMVGLGVGGLILIKITFKKALFFFGVLQGLSTLLISTLTFFPESKILLTAIVGFEDLTAGMGTAALVAFMASLTNKSFTASQYALFASLASLGRTLLAGYAGFIIEATGYFIFFIGCGAIALVGLGLLLKIRIESSQK